MNCSHSWVQESVAPNALICSARSPATVLKVSPQGGFRHRTRRTCNRERNRKPNRGGTGERGEGGDATLELKMRGPRVCEVYVFDS
ncbi:hypothetical protein SESBI_11070 [Sesbania bispinosa]|nr:hypothetical protein SESBI_11070 [Sesbania bispinosa]